MENRLRVGVISSVHGVHGECKVWPTTDDPKRFRDLKRVWLDNGRGDPLAAELRSVKFFRNMVICGFEGIDSPEAIRPFRGCDILIDRADAVELAEGEHFIGDLIGLEVRGEDGSVLGTADDIFPTGANQVLQVKRPGGKPLLIPYIPQCILEASPEEGFIRVHLLEGLLDL